MLASNKRCSGCKDYKHPEHFSKSKNTKDGLHNECRACHSVRAKREYADPAVKNKRAAQQQGYRKAHPEANMLVQIRNRCIRSGITFNLTIEDCKIPKVCPVLGILLVSGQVRVSGMHADNTPSMDRIDPTKGYVKGNVRVISWRANHLKNNATRQELEAIIEYMRSHEECYVL